MLILQETNEPYNMNEIPNELDFDLRYCILDYSNPNDSPLYPPVDFYFPQVVGLDQFAIQSYDLQIGPYRLQLPANWSIVIIDKDFGYMEIIEIKDLRDRPFTAFIMNPITGFMPDFGEIIHMNELPVISWHMPMLKNGHILAVPLENKKNPACIFCLHDTHRISESLDITKIFSEFTTK